MLQNLIQVPFSESQYLKEIHPKTQIYLHHTAGNASGIGTARFWETNTERVATAFIISGNIKNSTQEKDGTIVQCFGSKYFAYHLGLQPQTFRKFNLPFKSLDKFSIGIEICNWGNLKLVNGKFMNYVNREVPKSEVIELDTPFKGHKYWHNYTEAQLESTKNLLQYLCEKYNINKEYNADIWDICPRALKNESGIYTHNSVRTDKVDVYPHPKLIEIIKSL